MSSSSFFFEGVGAGEAPSGASPKGGGGGGATPLPHLSGYCR